MEDYEGKKLQQLKSLQGMYDIDSYKTLLCWVFLTNTDRESEKSV